MVAPFVLMIGSSLIRGAASQIGVSLVAIAIPVIINKVKEIRADKVNQKESAVDEALVPL